MNNEPSNCLHQQNNGIKVQNGCDRKITKDNNSGIIPYFLYLYSTIHLKGPCVCL